MLATASIDKTVKIWDTNSNNNNNNNSSSENRFECVAYKSLNVGRLFSLNVIIIITIIIIIIIIIAIISVTHP